MDVSPTLDEILEAVCSAVGVDAADVKNAKKQHLGGVRPMFAGIARLSCGCSAEDIAEFVGFSSGTVYRWLGEYRARRVDDPTYFEAEGTAKRALGLVYEVSTVQKISPKIRLLNAIAHPHWTPAQDLALLAFRDAGDPLDVVAAKMCRRTVEVTRRYHQLRVRPGVMDALLALQELGVDMGAPLQVAA